MKRGLWVIVAVAAAGLQLACAGTREAMADVRGAIPGLEETESGVVMAVRRDVIAVQLITPEAEKPVLFSRQEGTVVVRDGQPFDWNQLTEGTPVRVSFEPATGAERVFRVEVLTGREAQRVREQAGTMQRQQMEQQMQQQMD